jgi:hypothetical protein
MMISQRDERNGDGGFTAIANWRCIAAVCLITRTVLRQMTALLDALKLNYDWMAWVVRGLI